ncbi:MAG: HTH domain-containing protein, partial [Verrucomicrobiales bacterium]|nr:HTH domain-containing protein [Verrucomicrobiales bacterium]
MPAKKSARKRKSPTPAKGARSGNARRGDTRRPIERIFTIHQAIQRGRFPNCRQLAEQIEVTQKTIQRDITFMQNDLGLPLAY